MMKALPVLVLLAVAVPAIAEPLTVRSGETWMFTINGSEPAHARKVTATALPGPGEAKVSVRALFGTMMTITNNSPQGYTFNAQLVGADGKIVTARTCTLPPGNQPAMENWPQKSSAVTIGGFKPAKGGRC